MTESVEQNPWRGTVREVHDLLHFADFSPVLTAQDLKSLIVEVIERSPPAFFTADGPCECGAMSIRACAEMPSRHCGLWEET
jgi:hypothetical protein